MNWGTKIAIFYSFFAISMVSAVIYASKQSFDLVSPNYYAEEIAYENRIQEIRHASELETKLSIKTIIPESLSIIFPETLLIKKGSIRFYRPSNAALDKSFHIDPGLDTVRVDLKGWEKGNYDLQISWTDGSKNFYDERKIQILP